MSFLCEHTNSPESSNSRVQSPTGIYRSGCLGLSSMAYVTIQIHYGSIYASINQKKFLLDGIAGLDDERAPFPDFCTSQIKRQSLTSGLGVGEERVEQASRRRRFAVRECVLQEKVFLEILKISRENTCVRVSFLRKLQASDTGVFL